jgi:CTP synthase (UTP-ammonia lyase)
MTSGQVYKSVIDRERSGGYLGKTVQFIPHVPEEIIRRIKLAAEGFDVAIIEIGGTVGDYENEPFLFAAKSLERELGTENVAYVLVTYLPIPKHVGEMKTKPTQQAIKLLRQEGIFPDFILCRAEKPLDEARKNKIDSNVHISSDNIISAPDIESAYEVPINFQLEHLGQKVLKRLNLAPKKECDLSNWIRLVDNIKNPKNRVKVAVVGKYVKLGDYSVPDSYLSVKEAIVHAGAQLGVGVDITWFNADDFVQDLNKLGANKFGVKKLNELSDFDGVIVPGGFGSSGVEGKIAVIEYLRTHDIPFLGLCYGMQLAIVEYARHICKLEGANSTEIDKNTKYPVIDFLPEQKVAVENAQYGGTMRLGVYPAIMKDNSVVLKLYQDTYAGVSRLEADKVRFEKLVKEGVCRKPDNKNPENKNLGNKNIGNKNIGNKNFDIKNIILERHRHRYEVNPEFVEILEKNGLVFSGLYSRPDGTNLMEFIELPDHKFFVATQAHPEFKSRLGNPSPLFYGFLKACLQKDK